MSYISGYPLRAVIDESYIYGIADAIPSGADDANTVYESDFIYKTESSAPFWNSSALWIALAIGAILFFSGDKKKKAAS